MYDKNVISECIPTKLHTFDFEYICKKKHKILLGKYYLLTKLLTFKI